MAIQVRTLAQILAVSATTLGGCGGGTPVATTSTPASIEVRVSAGAPVSGATVTVFAISDATGQVNNSAGAGGVLGSAGPTDTSGKAVVSVRPYSGPVQIVAGGPAVSYQDPTSPADGLGIAPSVQVPASFLFSSYVAQFKPGVPVPVTLFTTLADHAALAYARGLHSTHPAKSTITDALAARDPLFVTHITNAAAAWDPRSLRWTNPAPLTTGPQSLVDSAFAAIFDVSLNQLARDTAVLAGYGTGLGGLTAPTLLQLLEDDIDADGRLDGLTFGGRSVATAGATPVVMDAQFLRRPLAIALAAWSRNAQVNKSGISDADLAGALVFKTITEDNSDLFGSAPTLPFDPLDRTPPEVTFATPPPQYAGAFNLRLAVTARDSSGVKAVYAQVGATRRTASLADGVWEVDVLLQAVGHNAITIWAEDTAEPAVNSGLGRGAPYQLDLDVTYDPDRPQAVYDSGFASYADERTISASTGADGLALVPAAYTGGTRIPVSNGGEIFKAATRLAAGGPLDATELESANAANIPVLRFSVPFNDKVDAPITKAEFTVAASCPGCGPIAAAHGQLLASPTPGVQALLYDLPLSTETVPALGKVTGPITLTVSLDLADAASNTASVGGFSFTFHVIGPPLAIVEDTAYAGYGDPRSAYPYKIAGLVSGVDTYSTLFDPNSPAFFEGKVRLVRYVVSNPSPDPVAIKPIFTQATGGSWQVTEVWPRTSQEEKPFTVVLDNAATATPIAIDGFQFYHALYWAFPYGTRGAGLPKTETSPHPCGSPANGWAAHRIGDTVTKWVCPGINPVGPTTTGVTASGLVTPAVYAGFQQGGGEVLAPTKDVTGTTFVVPGAVGSSPGTLVLYLTRPASAPRTRALRMNVIGTSNRYETYDYEIFWHYFTWSFVTPRVGSFTYEVYLMLKTGQYLQSATETLAGSLSVSTQGLAGSTLIGEPTTALSTSYTRTIATH
jgi:hypothetical protein